MKAALLIGVVIATIAFTQETRADPILTTILGGKHDQLPVLTSLGKGLGSIVNEVETLLKSVTDIINQLLKFVGLKLQSLGEAVDEILKIVDTAVASECKTELMSKLNEALIEFITKLKNKSAADIDAPIEDLWQKTANILDSIISKYEISDEVAEKIRTAVDEHVTPVVEEARKEIAA